MRLGRPSAWQVLSSVTALLVLCCGALVVSLHGDRGAMRDTSVGPLVDVLAHAAQQGQDAPRARAVAVARPATTAVDDVTGTARLLVSSGAAHSIVLRSLAGEVLARVDGGAERHGFTSSDPVTLPVRWSGGELRATLVLSQPASVTAVQRKADLLQGLGVLLLAVMAAGLLVIRRQHAGQVRVSLLDPLTGVGNRRQLDRAAQRALRSGSAPHGLLVLDLDGFKELNDTRGHAAGDDALVSLAEALHAATRPTDQVVRLGGDEFAVLVDDLAAGSPDDSLTAVLDRVRLAVPQIALSGGSAVWPRDGADLGTLLRVADEAMYADKRARRGREPLRSHA